MHHLSVLISISQHHNCKEACACEQCYTATAAQACKVFLLYLCTPSLRACSSSIVHFCFGCPEFLKQIKPINLLLFSTSSTSNIYLLQWLIAHHLVLLLLAVR